MKTKSRGGIVTKPSSAWYQDYSWDNNAQDWVRAGGRVTWETPIRNGKLETITYDDAKRSGTLKRTRWCEHTTVCMEERLSTHWYHTSANLNMVREYHNGGWFEPNVLTVPDLSSIHMEALDFFKSGCVEKHFDLAVDLLEWRQVATLLPSLRLSLKKFKDAFLRYGSDHLGKDLKTMLKQTSGVHLTYAFGVAPLVNDVMDLIKSLKALQDKVNWLRKNQGKPVKVRFSKDLSTIYRPDDIDYGGSGAEVVDRVLAYSCQYSAYALAVYNTQGLSDLELKLRILTRNFGLDKPLTWVYEMIPFSFILDWVFKVGDLIEHLAPSISLPYSFIDVGWSLKVREVRGMELVFRYPHKGDLTHFFGKRTSTIFHREPGLPISFSVVQGDPGLSQLALAISLAIQKWR